MSAVRRALKIGLWFGGDFAHPQGHHVEDAQAFEPTTHFEERLDQATARLKEMLDQEPPTTEAGFVEASTKLAEEKARLSEQTGALMTRFRETLSEDQDAMNSTAALNATELSSRQLDPESFCDPAACFEIGQVARMMETGFGDASANIVDADARNNDTSFGVLHCSGLECCSSAFTDTDDVRTGCVQIYVNMRGTHTGLERRADHQVGVSSNQLPLESSRVSSNQHCYLGAPRMPPPRDQSPLP